MTEVRLYDPERDSLDALGQMIEPGLRSWWRQALGRRFAPHNVLVAAQEGRLVGSVLLLDGGLPIALTEGFWIEPDQRGTGLFRRMVEEVRRELAARGVEIYARFGDPKTAAMFDRVGVPHIPGDYRLNAVRL